MAVRLAERHANRPEQGPRRRPKLMEKFVIEGGVPLSGTLAPAGNKNGALPILASSVLTEDEVIVRNVPRIRDVEAMLDILRSIGVEVAWRGPNEVALCAAGVHEVEVERELAELIRASFLLAGPLLARFHRAVMPPPGGDVIGRRRLDPHLDAFRAMGALTECGREIVLTAPRGLRPTDVFMDEPSVMATENALLAAALTPGTTVIGNAACEPHVQDLARMLVKMGADIHGIGSNLVTVNGAERLHGCEHDVAPDHIEIGSFMALAGVTGGELRIKDTVPAALGAARQRPVRARRPEAGGAGGRGGVQEQDPGRPVAGVPGRPHLDSGGAGHPG
jgi:UDP-N-acetylglucosamine 1-carboxyvinyltransferase